jgi:hypothetical protein
VGRIRSLNARRVDLTGARFDKLTAVSCAYVRGSKAYWNCKCDCGGEIIIRGGRLTKDGPKSCGCATTHGRRIQADNLIGKTFGQLTVIGLAGTIPPRNAYQWLCRCTCGASTFAMAHQLERRTVKSCGCLTAERNRELNSKRQFESTRNRTIRTYRRGAIRRGLDFALTDDELLRLFSLNCYYCGRPPQNKTVSEHDTGDFTYNGIDRKDNALGYIPGNVVPCCQVCNLAKRDMKFDSFIAWVISTADHLLSTGHSAIDPAVIHAGNWRRPVTN